MDTNSLTQADFERRIAQLESKINTLAQAASFGPNAQLVRAGQVPPRISGLTAVPSIRKVTWSWNPCPVQDLRHYIVEISPNSNMTSPTEFRTTQTYFIYEEGEPATTYYARVRANTNSGKTGAASNIVEATTDTAQTADLADGVITEGKIDTGAVITASSITVTPAETVASSTDNSAAFTEITGARITVVSNSGRSTFIFVVNTEGEATNVGAPTTIQNQLQTRLERGDGASPSSWTTIATSGDTRIATSGEAVISAVPVVPQSPGAGTYTYRVLARFHDIVSGAAVSIAQVQIVALRFTV